MENIKVPKLLEENEAYVLNIRIFKEITAFPFISIHYPLLFNKPASYKGAFSEYSASLYKLYHDYGGSLLCCFLNDTQKHHIRDIYKFRTAMFHGTLHDSALSQTVKKLNRYYLLRGEGQHEWRCFVESLDERDWKTIIEKIVSDSDSIYNTLSEIFNKHLNNPSREEMKCAVKEFFNYRVLHSILRDISQEYKYKNSSKLKKYMNEIQNSEAKNTIERWSSFAVQILDSKLNEPDELLYLLKKRIIIDMKL